MRLLLLGLTLLTLLLQYPLWWGKGGWLAVRALQNSVTTQEETNQALMARNAALQAEVHDLRSGSQAVEELARAEMGMLRTGEIFVQVLAPDEPEPPQAPESPTPHRPTRR